MEVSRYVRYCESRRISYKVYFLCGIVLLRVFCLSAISLKLTVLHGSVFVGFVHDLCKVLYFVQFNFAGRCDTTLSFIET